MSRSLTYRQYLDRLFDQSPIVKTIIEKLAPGRHPEDYLEDYLKQVPRAGSKEVLDELLETNLYGSELPLSVRAMLLILLMEVTPWIISGISFQPYSWEEAFNHRIKYDQLDPELQQLALELMLLYPEVSIHGSERPVFGYVSQLTGRSTESQGWSSYEPLLWAAKNGPAKNRSSYLQKIPWFPVNARHNHVAFRGYPEIIGETLFTLEERMLYDLRIRQLISKYDAQDNEHIGTGPYDFWQHEYGASLLRMYATMPVEQLLPLLQSEEWLHTMHEQFELIDRTAWVRNLHDCPPHHVLACLGRLYRLAEEHLLQGLATWLARWFEFPLSSQHKLQMQLFTQPLRAAVLALYQHQKTEQVEYCLDYSSDDAQWGIQLILDGKVKCQPETKYLLEYLPDRLNRLAVPALTG